MGLLGVFIYSGAFSLANGTNCLATGLPTVPDWVGYSPIAAVSLPIRFLSRTGATIILANGNGGGIDGEVFAPVCHSKIR